MKGKFIVIEGIDGSGKSTQVDLLCKRMNEQGMKTITTHEPSDGPIGKLLRKEYLSGKQESTSNMRSLLFVADRIDHILNSETGIMKTLDEGTNVICDRYYLSTCVYHLYGDNFNTDMTEFPKIMDINDYARKILSPDITIFINTDAEICMNRIASRGEEKSIFEKFHTLKQLTNLYYFVISHFIKEGDYIMIADGDKPVDQVAETVWNYTKKLMD